jgi:transposase
MRLTNEQWNIIAPLFTEKASLDRRGMPRRDPREVLEGILWILKTGAQWKQLPREYPPYQTCHRWFQRWREEGRIESVLVFLAQDMEDRGKIKLEECFIDGTFASAKKGAIRLARRSVEKARRSWLFRTKALFQSPSVWPLLLHTKSDWLRERLPDDLPERIHFAWWLTERTTPTPSMRSFKQMGFA